MTEEELTDLLDALYRKGETANIRAMARQEAHNISARILRAFAELEALGAAYNTARAELIADYDRHVGELTAENAKLRGALEELVELVEDYREGCYDIDSFTTQAAKAALT